MSKAETLLYNGVMPDSEPKYEPKPGTGLYGGPTEKSFQPILNPEGQEIKWPPPTEILAQKVQSPASKETVPATQESIQRAPKQAKRRSEEDSKVPRPDQIAHSTKEEKIASLEEKLKARGAALVKMQDERDDFQEDAERYRREREELTAKLVEEQKKYDSLIGRLGKLTSFLSATLNPEAIEIKPFEQFLHENGYNLQALKEIGLPNDFARKLVEKLNKDPEASPKNWADLIKIAGSLDQIGISQLGSEDLTPQELVERIRGVQEMVERETIKTPDMFFHPVIVSQTSGRIPKELGFREATRTIITKQSKIPKTEQAS